MMRIAFAAQGKTPNTQADHCFGRAPYFVIVGIETAEFETVANPLREMRDAVGVLVCRLLDSKGVEGVAVKNIGHNALVTLRSAGITVFRWTAGTVSEAIERMKGGETTGVERATVGFQDGLNWTA
jgi:predicted Fe-Mo cluster-binding NifX family protein